MNAPLTPEQLAVAQAPPGPVLVVAGAGTGKTTSLVARIHHMCLTGQWAPPHVLALTHSTKAAGHLQDALRRRDPLLAEVRARTFHSLALSLLEEHSPHPVPALADSAYSTMRAALRKCGLKDPDPTTVADCLSSVHRLKVSLQAPARGAAIVPGSSITAARLLTAYQQTLESHHQMDFSDMLIMAGELLRTHPAIADRVRAGIRHLVVDEYQDTDPAQQALVDLLLGERRDITAVGDPRQAIYSFKGATPTLLLNFENTYPDARKLDLSLNFRSTPEVISLANKLMAGQPGVALEASMASGPVPRLLVASREASETTLVVRAAKDLIDQGVAHQEIAILVRFNAQTAPFESALSGAQIPYVVLDGDRFFDRPEVLAVLRDAWQLMTQAESGQSEAVDLVDGDGAPYAPALPALGLALARHGFDPDAAPSGEGAARDRWEAQAALLELVSSMPGSAYLAARDVLKELADRREQAHTLTTRAVTVTTLHKAKGLEWDAVIIPRCVDGSLPSSRAKTPEALAEEQRLFYVGITRPRQHLIVSYARKRSNGTREWPATASPYLERAGFTVDNQDSLPVRPTRKTPIGSPLLCSTCGSALGQGVEKGLGQCLEHLTEADLAAVARITTMRDTYANERGLPNFSVFSDEAIGEIVKRRPTLPSQVASCGGIGARKARDFGDRVLNALRDIS